MKRKKPEITKNCAQCACAEPLSDKETMLCSRNGVVAGDALCRKFRYDPLKRVPTPAPKIAKLELDD